MKSKAESGVLKNAFVASLPVMAGYIFLGTAYGITMRESGFGITWTLLCSIFVYAGSMQFALVGLLSSAFSPVTTALMTLMVNARHLFYGLSMLKPYRDAGKNKPYLIFALTDETYSLVVQGAPDHYDSTKWFTAVSLMNQMYWVLGSIVGAAIGQLIPVDMTGIEFSMTALFAVIVTEQAMDSIHSWKTGQKKWSEAFVPVILGSISTVVSLLCIGKNGFLIAAMIAMLVCFYGMYVIEKKGTANE